MRRTGAVSRGRREAVAIAGDDLAGRLLVYAEVEDGVISADLFYKNREGDVRLVLGPSPLDDLVYEFWQRWKAEPGNEDWRLMSYIVDKDGEDAQMKIHLTYPDHVEVEGDLVDLRDRAIKEYFGAVMLVFDDPFA
jgi:hypothetical protein